MNKKYEWIVGIKGMQELLTCMTKNLLGLMTNGLDDLLT